MLSPSAPDLTTGLKGRQALMICRNLRSLHGALSKCRCLRKLPSIPNHRGNLWTILQKSNPPGYN